MWISVSVMERRPVKLVRTIRFPGPLPQVLSLGVRQKELDEGSAEGPVGAAPHEVDVMGELVSLARRDNAITYLLEFPLEPTALAESRCNDT